MNSYIGKRSIYRHEGDRIKIDYTNGFCEVLNPKGENLLSADIHYWKYSMDLKYNIKQKGKEFDWGYVGVYPSNLAKSIMADFLNVEPKDIPHEAIDRFCSEVISVLPYEGFELNADELKEYLKRIFGELYEVEFEE